MQSPVENIMGKLAISEMVLLDESSNKQRVTRRVVDVFRWWVSTNSESTKQWVDPESMRAQNGILLSWSWPRIKRERSKGNKEWMKIRKSRCIESNQTRCCTGKFNATLSLCGVLGVALYFSEGFSKVVAEALQPLGKWRNELASKKR